MAEVDADEAERRALAKKLGVRDDGVVLVHAPAEWAARRLGEANEVGRADAVDAPGRTVVVLFVRSRAGLTADLPALAAAVHPDAVLWVAWPRKAGGHVSDLGDTVVRDTVLPTGLVDVKVAMLDTDWSGLQFRWRTALR